MSSRWDELTAELSQCDPEEALELLIDWGRQLPPLSPARAALPLSDDCRVRECQTAVHLWVGLTPAGAEDEGGARRVELEATVPEKSPTVRGLVALIVLGLTGEPVARVLATPVDLLATLGLDKVLGMQRRQGVQGVMQRIHSEVRRLLAEATPASGG